MTPDTILDLDGDGGGVVSATGGDLRFRGAIAPIDGWLVVRAGRLIDIEEQWTLGEQGLVSLRGDVSSSTELHGTEGVIIHGGIIAEGTSLIAKFAVAI